WSPRGDAPVDKITLTNAESGRRSATQLLAGHLADGNKGEAAGAVAGLLAWGLGQLASRPERAELTLASVVRERVPQAVRPAYRTDKGGVWAEAPGREMARGEFVCWTPNALLEAAALADDAPRNAAGSVDRPRLLKALKAELELLWADLL